jgi:5,10-methylene-tetrahydrofolate dehydrogenase/methenyl tetrahydrofolate cyclohydrolase
VSSLIVCRYPHRSDEKYDRAADVVLAVVGEPKIEMRWVDDSHLFVDWGCNDGDVRFRMPQKHDDGLVQITTRLDLVRKH